MVCAARSIVMIVRAADARSGCSSTGVVSAVVSTSEAGGRGVVVAGACGASANGGLDGKLVSTKLSKGCDKTTHLIVMLLGEKTHVYSVAGFCD
jgi:hypothetical protein